MSIHNEWLSEFQRLEAENRRLHLHHESIHDDREAEGRELGPALAGMPEDDLEELQGIRAARCIQRLKAVGLEALKHAGEAYTLGFKDCEKSLKERVKNLIAEAERHQPGDFGEKGIELLYCLRLEFGLLEGLRAAVAQAEGESPDG